MIPLFSHLTEEAFIHVLGSLRLRRFASTEKIITEGEPGDSFYMLADGEVVVSKKLAGNEVQKALDKVLDKNLDKKTKGQINDLLKGIFGKKKK